MSERDLKPDEIKAMVSYLQQHHGKRALQLRFDHSHLPGLTESRVGGVPYWDFAQEYPRTKAGQPLRFLAQINLAQISPEELKALSLPLPEKGLLQFFLYPDEDLSCAQEEGKRRVIYHPDVPEIVSLSKARHKQEQKAQLRRFADKGLGLEHVCNLQFEDSTLFHATEPDYLNEWVWPVTGECAFKLVPFLALPGCGDFGLMSTLLRPLWQQWGWEIDPEHEDGDWLLFSLTDDAMEALTKAVYQAQNFPETPYDFNKSCLLGYPDFTQCSPLEPDSPYQLLFQLDSGDNSDGENVDVEEFEVMWGDCGICNFFIKPEQLKQLDFSDVLFNWDCC